jgi:hypothetical protein
VLRVAPPFQQLFVIRHRLAVIFLVRGQVQRKSSLIPESGSGVYCARNIRCG